MMKQFIQINPDDNVAVALQDLPRATSCQLDNGQSITLVDEIKRGHKFALSQILANENIIKYGSPIGHATELIAAGSWIHTHNLKTNLSGVYEYSYQPQLKQLAFVNEQRSFMGYRRSNGKIGIRNELWIIPTVGCVNGTAESIRDKFLAQVGPLNNVECVNILKHSFGCSQLGDDHCNTRTILAAAALHPNCGGALVLGLGCENNTMPEFIKTLGDYDQSRVKYLVSQQVSDEVAAGVQVLHELYALMQDDQRSECPLSELKIGLKCGASDGFSGISANPLVGAFSDYMVAQGASTILTEVPEMFGAETILMQRAINRDVYDKTVALINNFKNYFIAHNQEIYENPSPGNKAGGISSLEDKSLGCTQKSGVAPVVGVLEYGEQLTQNGLNLLNAPGNDLVASSALAASGCQMVLFTTGRGTPFGSFVPTIKISTNSAIAELKPHWIDFNAGKLLDDQSMEQVLHDFISYILEVAEGKLVNNEINQFRELAIFKSGVTL